MNKIMSSSFALVLLTAFGAMEAKRDHKLTPVEASERLVDVRGSIATTSVIQDATTRQITSYSTVKSGGAEFSVAPTASIVGNAALPNSNEYLCSQSPQAINPYNGCLTIFSSLTTVVFDKPFCDVPSVVLNGTVTNLNALPHPAGVLTVFSEATPTNVTPAGFQVLFTMYLVSCPDCVITPISKYVSVISAIQDNLASYLVNGGVDFIAQGRRSH